MVKPSKKVYCPTRPLKKIYDQLFGEYTKLHDAFGRPQTGVMKNLRLIQKEAMR
jgi:hypothetical protein